MTPLRHSPRLLATAVVLGAACVATAVRGEAPSPPTDPFRGFTLPEEWQDRFWAGPDARALLKMEPKEVAALVPSQAGLRFCRCPACDAEEGADPLGWSVAAPKGLTCKVCRVTLPNDKYPATDDKKKAPEEAVEVAPGVSHTYPYHEVEPSRQRYAGERLYLAAKADYEARAFLAKAALYAAVRAERTGTPAEERRALRRLAALILVRCAQVYPLYATHVDQPGEPKFFQQADLAPPYRLGYKTAKWDWSGSLDVPLNLVVAYALVRDGPELSEAGGLLNEPDPRRKLEDDLFRASARFVAGQPESFDETCLQATRGILAVGRLLEDPALLRDGLARLRRLGDRGFYHDGFWREGTLTAHLRVLNQFDGWIARLLGGGPGGVVRLGPGDGRVGGRPDGTTPPWLALAREAGAALLTDTTAPELLRASWPAPARRESPRSPRLLGGAGLARLALGRGDDALDLELRSLDSFGPDSIRRQALRLGVAGRTLLGDLDELPPLPDGWDRASVSRNTVVIDGLNQRESPSQAKVPAPGGDILFFAADPDFQVVTLDDPRAYPDSATRYRQTLLATSGRRARYALSVFEVAGGLQHDQVFHAASSTAGRWELTLPTTAGPATLLPPGLTLVRSSQTHDGRWFVQAYGALRPDAQAAVERPTTARLVFPDPSATGLRLHLLGDAPATAILAGGPDPAAPDAASPGARGTLLLRRRSPQGATLDTQFVTLFEPVGEAFPRLRRVGRVASPRGTIVVYVESDDGPEHLVVNLTPGTPRTVTLVDGRPLTTDGLAVRHAPAGLTLAGGTFAECGGRRVAQAAAAGTLSRVVRPRDDPAGGWFETRDAVPDPDRLAGRALVVRHGDGVTRGWTVARVEGQPAGARIYVREDPGFALDDADGEARYARFPGGSHPGPHSFRIGRITR